MQPSRRAAEDGTLAGAPAQPSRGDDGDAGLAALRDRGAQHLNPAHFRYLEALARRVRGHDGNVRDMLDQRLARALAAYGTQYDAAVCELGQLVPVVANRHPQAAQDLRRLQVDGNVRAVRKLAARLDDEARPGGGPLAVLVRHIEDHSAAHAQTHGSYLEAAPVGAATPPLGELKTVQRFRATWNRLRVDEQLTRSQAKIPENPGPLNSHLLVLRALRRMQELSPAYLERFMAHVDALLWLDGAGIRGPAPTVKAASRARDKRKKGKGDKVGDAN